MSELNIFSISALVGSAAGGIANLISKTCGAVWQYKPKNAYLSTPEREMVLQSHYFKNFAEFEDKYFSKESAKAFQNAVTHLDRAKVNHAVSMFETLSHIEPMEFVARTKYGEKWKSMESVISKIKKELKTPTCDFKDTKFLAEENESLIRKIANDSHSLLAKSEDEVLLNTVTDSMSSLAYKIKSDRFSLLASKGPVSVRAKISGGRLKLDTTSFPGFSCHAEIQRIEIELKKRGLILRSLCENTMNLRKNSVRLQDPFPACPSETQNSDNQLRRQNFTTKKAGDLNGMSNNSLQRFLRHRNRNYIRKK